MNANKTGHVTAVVIFVILSLGAFSYIMTTPLDHDEHAYFTPGVLIKDNYVLNEDFIFAQMPYFPIFYGMFYKLTGVSHYFLWGRIFVFVFAILSGLLIYLISYRMTKSLFISVNIFALFVLNKLTIQIIKHPTNAAMAGAFALMGVYLFLLGISKEGVRSLGVFFCGICLALAAGIRLLYAVTVPPFFLISLFYPRGLTYKRRFVMIFLPLLCGVIVGLMPAFYYLIKDVDIFIYCNYTHHILNTQWRAITGYTTAMSMMSKIYLGKEVFALPSSIAVFIGISFLFFTVAVVSEERPLKFSLRRFLQMESLLFILLILFTVLAIFIQTPLFVSHFALPMPFMIILIGYWCSLISGQRRFLAQTLLIYLVFISLVFGGATVVKRIAQLQDIDRWTAISVYRTAQRIRDSIGLTKEGEKIATLSPLYAMEANLPIYNELATGPFHYRVGDLIPAYKRKRYVATSQKSLRTLFEKTPPKAIFVGFEGELDLPFIKYAEENNYTKVEKDFSGGVLYVRADK